MYSNEPKLIEGARGLDHSVYVLLYMLDCVAAVACVVMGLEATEDRKAAVREMIKQVRPILSF